MSREQQLQMALAQVTLPPQVTIRAWIDSDFPVVRDLALTEGWTTLCDRPADGLRAWQRAWPALVVMHGAQLIGFVRAVTNEAVTLYVADLLVAPEWRGQRIGTALLELCHLLYPTVRLDLLAIEQAGAFYQAQGFRPFRGFRKSFV
jgi:GNAT superfamily N-acetyltransferase